MSASAGPVPVNGLPGNFIPAPQAATRTVETAPLGRAALVLSRADAARYVEIFAAQDRADWHRADELTALLHDRRLIGAVLAQRYLASAYPATADQVRDWLDRFGDQPEAAAMALLARSKGATIVPPAAPASPPAPLQPVASTEAVDSIHRPREFGAALDAWRRGNWTEAARHFEQVAETLSVSGWYRAAGAFWAARAHLKRGDLERVDRWYRRAAEHSQTFYGLLARETLGLIPRNDGTSSMLTARDVARLNAVPAGGRALALLQIGQIARAEAELMRVAPGADPDLANAIVALADVAHLPSLCLALGNETMRDRHAQQALYPLPSWRPRRGFSVDRALLFALMMEESRFITTAQSESGAAGVMQLMPATARAMAHDAGVQVRAQSDLADPELSLSLGQEYVKRLIGNDQVNGSLILLLAAYNTGPGPLQKWLASAPKDDPLLFIEALPRLDTRLYVQRVLTNLWIYRQRLGEATPDLVTLAGNGWPAYVSVEPSAQPKAADDDAVR